MKIELLAETGFNGQGVDALTNLLLETMKAEADGKSISELVGRFFTPVVGRNVIQLLEGGRPKLNTVDLTEIAAVCGKPVVHILTLVGALTFWEGVSSDEDIFRAFMKMRADYLHQLFSGKEVDADLKKSLEGITDMLTNASVEALRGNKPRLANGMMCAEVDFSVH